MSQRRAALRLHGLCREDQERILAELAPADQASLRASLMELELLGFPKDAYLHAGSGSAPGATAPLQPVLALDQADPAAVFAVLRGEPESLIAALLAERDWSWKEGFLGRLEAGHRGRLQLLASSARPLTPQLRAAMVGAIQQALQSMQVQVPVTTVTPSRTGPRPRWKAWIR